MEDGPLARLVLRLDGALETLGKLFLVIANLCLLLMLIGTAATILLRPINLSFYWIWPWTMQFFVWMSFFGFYAVYRFRKDIAVDFVVLRLGDGAMIGTRYFVALVVLAVTGVILWQMPTIIESQVGVIDAVVTPWGELERYTLSIPLGISCLLIFVNALLDLLKAWLGWPEPHTLPAIDS
ncbi:TRAP transporter small permease subunit [Pelagibius litoralis]|uniref:TRAP transporter small permease protein n=1 Tax=Pelagibius litoralis TaxID=374515 RepID=A0A967C3B3_9PROT|nr:TRAP transporter small permease subunit [Pelagibius litoralis]NIA67659.1 TRAP transporter small permease subunit [Pelagibius litoralis]